MKPISDQPPLPLPPRQGDVPGVIRWAGDLTRQLFTFLREISLRLNHAFTDDNVGLKTINDADLTEEQVGILLDIATGDTPSGGDVVGPTSAISGHLAVFDGATGKLVKDGGAVPANGDVVGPAGVTSGNVAVFDGASGKLLKSGGTLGSAAFTASSAYLAAGGTAVNSSALGGQTSSYYQQNINNSVTVEIGSSLTGDRNSYVDFHSDDTNTDFSARIIRTPGVNGALDISNIGSGRINLTATGGVWVNGVQIGV